MSSHQDSTAFAYSSQAAATAGLKDAVAQGRVQILD